MCVGKIYTPWKCHWQTQWGWAHRCMSWRECGSWSGRRGGCRPPQICLVWLERQLQRCQPWSQTARCGDSWGSSSQAQRLAGRSRSRVHLQRWAVPSGHTWAGTRPHTAQTRWDFSSLPDQTCAQLVSSQEQSQIQHQFPHAWNVAPIIKILIGEKKIDFQSTKYSISKI